MTRIASLRLRPSCILQRTQHSELKQRLQISATNARIEWSEKTLQFATDKRKNAKSFSTRIIVISMKFPDLPFEFRLSAITVLPISTRMYRPNELVEDSR